MSAVCVALALVASAFVLPVNAGLVDAWEYNEERFKDWMTPGDGLDILGGWNIVDYKNALFQSNKNQNYYTEPTESVQDKYGNVTNYYRGGDTTNMKIIDSYNRTFNTIHNTTNHTNNYSANIKLNDFLNSYTTYNNDYSYSADFKSWYYDTDTHNYNYTNNQTYYNTDNSKYYVSIDNSSDEYYLVDIQYSPTFVTVNYEYNTTNINNSTTYGDVTNVYYYELDDGRNSYTLTVSEALGIVSGYDVVNYELVHDDPDTLSLQHFDADYTDSSAYGRQYFSVNRSTSYVDSGAFGKAVKLPSGSAAGVNIPNLSSYSSLQIDFRVYFDSLSSLNVYFGDTVLFGRIPSGQSAYFHRVYSDHEQDCIIKTEGYDMPSIYTTYYPFQFSSISPSWSTSYTDESYTLTSGLSSSYGAYYEKYGNLSLEEGSYYQSVRTNDYADGKRYDWSISGIKTHYKSMTASKPFVGSYVAVSNLSNYLNQWVSFRIVLTGNQCYLFANGDNVGAGNFAMPSGSQVYIKSNGTVYLDELRVSTGSLVNTSSYNPAETPYDTNMVLALPDQLTANTIYVRHQVPVNGWRIGGVRPSAPVSGFFYVPLHSDYSASKPLFYDGSNWVDVDAVISVDGVSVVDIVGFKFTPAAAAPDVNPDLQPTPDGGSSGDGAGGSGDESGGESEDDKTGLLDGVLKKLFSLVEKVIGSILDGIISLAESVIDRLTSVVNIFGSFGESLSLLWSWLPPEVVSVLVTAVTVIVFVCVVKIVL